jgi:hypothetical protein
VIKANKEELEQKIVKLKKSAAEAVSKAAGNKHESGARATRKKLKRTQRKLREVVNYKKKSAKKAEEKKAAGTPAAPAA